MNTTITLNRIRCGDVKAAVGFDARTYQQARDTVQRLRLMLCGIDGPERYDRHEAIAEALNDAAVVLGEAMDNAVHAAVSAGAPDVIDDLLSGASVREGA